MRRLHRALLVAALALMVAGCSGSSSRTEATKPPGTAATPPTQHYLDTVNGLCDHLLAKVVRVTHGGSIDIPARRYLHEWPAHRRVLAAFDRSLAAVPVPTEAARQASALRHYVVFADRLDAQRLRAAREGQRAWRREVAAESNVESAPAIAARNAAGFAPSCDAR